MRQQGSIYQSGAAPILDFLEEHKQDSVGTQFTVLCSTQVYPVNFPIYSFFYGSHAHGGTTAHSCLLSGMCTALYFV